MTALNDAIREALAKVHDQDCEREKGPLSRWSMADVGQVADRVYAWLVYEDDER